MRNGATLINQGGIAGSLTVDAGGVYGGGGSVGNLNVNGTLRTNTGLQMGGSPGLMVGLDQRDTPILAASGVPTEARNLNDPNARGRLWLPIMG